MTEGVFIDSDDEQKNDREYEGSTHPSDRKSFVKYAVVSSNIQSVHLEEVREFRTLPLNEKVKNECKFIKLFAASCLWNKGHLFFIPIFHILAT